MKNFHIKLPNIGTAKMYSICNMHQAPIDAIMPVSALCYCLHHIAIIYLCVLSPPLLYCHNTYMHCVAAITLLPSYLYIHCVTATITLLPSYLYLCIEYLYLHVIATITPISASGYCHHICISIILLP